MALTRVAPAGIGSTPGTGYVIGDSFLHSRGLNATDGYYTGIVTTQSLRVLGDLEVEGTTTTLDTALTEVDKLEVGANNNTVGVAITQSGTGDILSLYDGSTQVVTVKDGGRVGIGTDGPLAKLEVYTDSNDVGGIVQVIQDGTGDASIDFQLKGTREYTLGIDNSDGDKFKLSGSAGLGSNDLITVTSAGLVGIETANPRYPLEVNNGNLLISGSAAGNLILEDRGVGDSSRPFALLASNGGNITITNANRNASGTTTSSVERLRITSDGNITTSGLTGVTAQTGNTFYESDSRIVQIDGGDSQGWLTLGSSRSDTDAYVGGINFINRYGQQDHHRFLGYIRLKSAHVPGYGTNILKGQLEFTTKSSSASISTTTPDMVISHNGSVGIGTDNPNYLLDVYKSTGTDQDVFSVRGQTSAFLVQCSDLSAANPTWNLRSFSAEDIALKPGNSESVRFKADGKVGIGTNSPDNLLHLSGTNTTVWPFGSDVSGLYAYSPYPHELQIQNHARDVTGAFAGIYFHSGSSADGSYVSSARIAAIDSGNYRSDLAFGTRNTNFGERLRIRYDGNIGIGTDNPGVILDIRERKTAGSTQVRVYNTDNSNATTQTAEVSLSPDSRALAGAGIKVFKENADFSTNANRDISLALNVVQNNSQTEAVRITSDGTVGINNESPSTTYKLDVAGAGIFATDSNLESNDFNVGQLTVKNTQASKGAFIDFRADSNNGTTGVIAKIGGFNTFNGTGYDGALTFSTRKSLGNTMNERLRITKDGNVGIGVTDPDSKFHVNSGAETVPARFESTGAQSRIGFQASGTPTSYHVACGAEANNFIVYTDNAEKLRITSGGSVGFNTTFTQSSKTVHIAGDYRSETQNVADEGLIFQSFSTPTTGDVYPGISWTGNPGALGRARASITAVASNSNSGSDLVFLTRNQADGTELNRVNNEKLRIKDNGRIGIGVTNPQHLLHLKSAGDATILIQADSDNSGENDNPRLLFAQDGSTMGMLELGLIGDANQPLNNAPVNSCYIQANNHADQPLCIGHMGENVMTVKSDRVGIGTNNPTEALHVIGQNRGSAGTGSKWDIARFVAHNYVPTNSGGLTIGGYWHNTDVNQRRAYIQSSQNTNSGSTVRDLLLNPDGGNIGIGRDDPSYLLDIRQYTNTSGTNTGTTMLRLQNNVGADSGSLGDITGVNGQRTYIDFTFIDGNVNFTPQVRIGAQVGNPSGSDAGIENEGSGSFVVYTAKGSGNAGSGTLTEKLKVTPNGNVRASNAFYGGGGNIMGMVPLGSSSGNTVIDTGISINASNGGGAMMVLACRNTSDQTSTAAGMYLLDFRYNGNHVPGVTFIGGDNFCVFGKTAGNNLTVNCQSGNWSVSGFFAGYGIGNQLNA